MKGELRFILDKGSASIMHKILNSFLGNLRFRSVLIDNTEDLNRWEFIVTGYSVKQKHFIEQCLLLFRHGCISK